MGLYGVPFHICRDDGTNQSKTGRLATLICTRRNKVVLLDCLMFAYVTVCSQGRGINIQTIIYDLLKLSLALFLATQQNENALFASNAAVY
jgi:hypothetical protein